MKRNLSAKSERMITPMREDKQAERELSKAIESMVKSMSAQWKKEVLKSMTKETISKFEDAKQSGNFASVFDALSRAANNKLIKKYNDVKIGKLIKKILLNTERKNADAIYTQIEGITGINQKQLYGEEGLKSTINAYLSETTSWVKKLRDDSLEQYSTNVLRAMSLGQGIDDIMKQFDGMVETRKGHARMVARTQVSTFNSLMNKTRAQNLGIEEAVWLSGGDARVRESHRERDGKRFRLDKGLYSSKDKKWLLPGTDYQCRCTYRMIIPEESE